MAVMNFLLDILISSSVSLQTPGGRHGKTKQNAPKDVENPMKIIEFHVKNMKERISDSSSNPTWLFVGRVLFLKSINITWLE